VTKTRHFFLDPRRQSTLFGIRKARGREGLPVDWTRSISTVGRWSTPGNRHPKNKPLASLRPIRRKGDKCFNRSTSLRKKFHMQSRFSESSPLPVGQVWFSIPTFGIIMGGSNRNDTRGLLKYCGKRLFSNLFNRIGPEKEKMNPVVKETYTLLERDHGKDPAKLI